MTSPETTLRQNRRQFLDGAGLGLGRMALAALLVGEGHAAASSGPVPLRVARPAHFPARAKHVIFLFMAGAPSHLDLFEPKPLLAELHGQPVPPSFLEGLPDPVIRASARVFNTPRTFRRYGKAGMPFSDFLPHLATCADDLTMVRSLWTTSANHDPGQLLMNCGTIQFGHPAMGAWVTYGLGSEAEDLPAFVVMLSNSGLGLDGGAALWSSGFLPSHYRGITLRSQGDPILHLSSPEGVSRQMQRARLEAIQDLNRLRERSAPDREIASRITAYELAFRMQMAAPEALDLSRESAATREAYGLNQEKTRWFGTHCLTARRLVERGVRFVQLYHTTWDDHSDLNRRLQTNCEMTDRPAAALIWDLKQRGLLDETLVIWGGEFGRTPMNEFRRGVSPGKEGRDHHPYGFTMLLAGGGIPGGRIVGSTDALGYHAVEDRMHVHDLQATLLHCLGLDHRRLTYRHQGRDFRLTDVGGRVMQKLLAG